MLRRVAVSIVILGAVILGPVRTTPTHAAPMAHVSFALNWISNVEFAGLWVGQQKGYWERAGIAVTAKPYDFNTDPVLLVGTGKYTFGFQDGASLIIARARHIPVKAVWASGQQSPFAFITMPHSGITTVRDFRGKRIGYQAHEKYVLEAMLNHEGLTIADVKPVVVGYDPTLLVAGKVDAYLAYLTNEPIELALGKNHLKVNVIPASQYGYTFYSDVLFTTDSVIKSNPALVRTVVSVMDRGWRYALTHPDEAAHIVVPRLDNQDSVAQQVAEMKALTPLATASGAPLGSMSAARWQEGITLLLRYRQIPSRVAPDAVFTPRFLPR